MVHGFPAGLVDRVHGNNIECGTVHAGLACDAAGGRVTSCDGAVVKKKNLRVLVQTELLASVYGHVRHNGPGRVLRQLVRFPQGVDLHNVVAVESRLNDGTGLGKSNFSSSDLTDRIISFCCHITSSLFKSKLCVYYRTL